VRRTPLGTGRLEPVPRALRPQLIARRCAQLQTALDSRVVIEQANGILAAARLDLPVDQTFTLGAQSST
jgi:hypothetical protein